MTTGVDYQEPAIPKTAREIVDEKFGADSEIMWRIFECESEHRQFRYGTTTLVSPTHDYGFAQINRKTWDATAQRLGLDYQNNLEDNLEMAHHVYTVQGKTAWVCYWKVI